jgi:glycosyltransferase involved in cell wall biosynthesis
MGVRVKSGPLRVTHVIPGYYPSEAYGGPITSIHETCNALAGRGVSVRVITTNLDGKPGRWLDVPTDTDAELAPNYRVRYYASSGRAWHWSNAFMLGLNRDISAADVLHLQDVYSLHALWALMLSRWNRVPVLISPRGIYSAWALSSGRRWVKSIWNNVLYRALTKATKTVGWHATSEQEKRDIERQFPGCVCHVVPNAMKTDLQTHLAAVDQNQYLNRFAGQLKRKPRVRVLVCLGRINAIKAYDVAIDALALMVKTDPEVVLLIAGQDDGEQPRLIAQVEALGLKQHVAFTGHLDEAAKAMLLKGADVLLCPSHSENFGMSVLEALSVGCPVVASKGTPWKNLETSGAGLWVQNTAQDFATATVQVLSQTESWQDKAMALASRYDLSAQAKKFEKIYRDLAGMHN